MESDADHMQDALQHLSAAFGAINCLPHGDGKQAERLAQAQQALADCRKILDLWYEEHKHAVLRGEWDR